ncbi:hypothetical protein BU16DRAFT_543703 [Lophium mytilinum]|uniref:Uncharacterized protein n=1 Tax=Lophium mytilinum TaxID=390894 RepID=A0A6A6QDM1_9PEZI|nr:hypothetical protein BU16DRAFT_543703 [Lophium mytilinum]
MPSPTGSPSSTASNDSFVDAPQALSVTQAQMALIREQLWLQAPPVPSPRRAEGSFYPDKDDERIPCECRIPGLFPDLVATPATPDAPLRVVPEGDPDANYQVLITQYCPHDRCQVVFAFHLAGTVVQTDFEAFWEAGWQVEEPQRLSRVDLDTVTVYKIVRDWEVLPGQIIRGNVTVAEFVGACLALEDAYAALLEEEGEEEFERALAEAEGDEEGEEDEEMEFVLTEEEYAEWLLDTEME